MRAKCSVCGDGFEAKTQRARYCSGACKKRGADLRKRTGDVVTLRSVTVGGDSLHPAELRGVLVDGLRAEFKPEDLASTLGLTAVRLAQDIDQLLPGTPGYAAVVKQWREALDDLRSFAKPKQATPLALLRERRAADRAASAG